MCLSMKPIKTNSLCIYIYYILFLVMEESVEFKFVFTNVFKYEICKDKFVAL